jgi:hypothetical protein
MVLTLLVHIRKVRLQPSRLPVASPPVDSSIFPATLLPLPIAAQAAPFYFKMVLTLSVHIRKVWLQPSRPPVASPPVDSSIFPTTLLPLPIAAQAAPFHLKMVLTLLVHFRKVRVGVREVRADADVKQCPVLQLQLLQAPRGILVGPIIPTSFTILSLKSLTDKA